ncbi:MAG: hypothetical protein KBT34_02980 [Prevotella sp.]|nr:hypothetical protein [Candidatus Prevotella equi]
MAYTPIQVKRTISEERNYEHEKALRALKKCKKIEAEMPMVCTTVNKMRVCATSEEKLNELVEQLKNR